MYYSNRSAAYLQKGDAYNALEDANACIGLDPDFPKGYSRKGAALHALKRYNDSIAAYQEGLAKFPTDAGLQKGLSDVQREKDNPYGIPGASNSSSGSKAPPGGVPALFSPQMVAQLMLDPKVRPLLQDPEVMAKIQLIQKNPNLLPSMLNDPKIMNLFGVMMGQDGKDGDDDDEEGRPTFTSRTAPASSSKPSVEKNQPPPSVADEMDEDWSDLSPEEQKVKEAQKASRKKKEEGNELYKSKKFDEALAAYDEAIALDPTNMTFLLNKAAVYLTRKNYDACIETCLQAVEVGKANHASFEERAKAYARCAKAYQQKGDLAKAIEMCQQAQLESFDKDTQRLLKTMELEKRKADALAYQDDAKAEEAKQRGNDLFRQQKYGESVKEYEEAVKRAPKNAVYRNNLSAALSKICDFNGAKREVEIALELDPKYVKAYARKGDIEVYMKENHKAMESYRKGLEIDPSNTACLEGLHKVTNLVNYGRHNMTEDQKKEMAAHAMADPEIQAILQDPVMQQILKDFQENPKAAQQAMANPGVRSKIEKLIASGIVEAR